MNSIDAGNLNRFFKVFSSTHLEKLRKLNFVHATDSSSDHIDYFIQGIFIVISFLMYALWKDERQKASTKNENSEKAKRRIAARKIHIKQY